jgi:hypothetical protein
MDRVLKSKPKVERLSTSEEAVVQQALHESQMEYIAREAKETPRRKTEGKRRA